MRENNKKIARDFYIVYNREFPLLSAQVLLFLSSAQAGDATSGRVAKPPVFENNKKSQTVV